MRQRGFTLIELLVATLLLVGGGGALLVGMQYSMFHADYLSQFQIAMNAAQGKIEELSTTSFDTLWSGVEFTDARRSYPPGPSGRCAGLGEDTNCNGVLDAGEDLNGNNLLDEPLPGARLLIQIRSADTRTPTNPSLITVHVAACWTSRGRRIGEDVNCNGVLDANEDKNNNGWADSPSMADTIIARKN